MKCNVIFVAGGVLRRNAPEGCSGRMLGRDAWEGGSGEESRRIRPDCRPLSAGQWIMGYFEIL